MIHFSKIKTIYPEQELSNGFNLCEYPVEIPIHNITLNINHVAYIIIYVEGNTKKHCNSLLLPIDREGAIKTFKEKYL